MFEYTYTLAIHVFIKAVEIAGKEHHTRLHVTRSWTVTRRYIYLSSLFSRMLLFPLSFFCILFLISVVKKIKDEIVSFMITLSSSYYSSSSSTLYHILVVTSQYYCFLFPSFPLFTTGSLYFSKLSFFSLFQSSKQI